MSTKFNPFTGSSKKRASFWWGIRIGVILALLIWWWLENQPKAPQKKYSVKFRHPVFPEDRPDETSAPEMKSLPQEPEKAEDLKRIDGIGPRSAGVLEDAGILTFAQLAAMEPEQIKAILQAAGLRIGHPATWPEQAALAAAGQWDELEALQSTLKGGRKV